MLGNTHPEIPWFSKLQKQPVKCFEYCLMMWGVLSCTSASSFTDAFSPSQSVSLSLSPCQPLPFLFSNAGWFVKKIRKNKRSLKVIYLLLIYTDNLLQYFPAILGVHIPTDKIMVSPCFSKFLHSSYIITSLRILLFWQYLLTHIGI